MPTIARLQLRAMPKSWHVNVIKGIQAWITNGYWVLLHLFTTLLMDQLQFCAMNRPTWTSISFSFLLLDVFFYVDLILNYNFLVGMHKLKSVRTVT